MRNKPEPTPETIKEGLAKLLMEARALTRQTEALRKQIAPFVDDKGLRPPDIIRDHWRVQSETEAPKSAIRELDWELGNRDDLSIATRAILAIAKEFNGALLDIRATREEIRAINEAPDFRAEWKTWQAHSK